MNLRFQPGNTTVAEATAEPAHDTSDVFERVVARLDTLLKPCEAAIARLFERPLGVTEAEPCLDALAQLARWLEELGSPAESRTALNLRNALGHRLGTDEPDAAWSVEAAEMVEELRSVIAVKPPNLSADGAKILVIGPVTEELDTLIWSALEAGLVIGHGDLDAEVSPDLVVVAAPASASNVGQGVDIVDTARNARERHPTALMLVTKDEVSLAEQEEVSRFCDSLVVGSTRATTLLEEVHLLLDRRRNHLRLVQLASSHSPDVEELTSVGLNVIQVPDVAGVISQLESGRMNAVIVTSTFVGEHDDLISLIRSRPEMRRAAVIETTILDRGVAWTTYPGSRPDAQVPVELGSVGVAEAVMELIGRRCEIGAVPRSGSTTGLPWFSGRARAERLLVLARRHERPVTVGIVRFEESEADEDIDEIQAELSRQFRDDDVVARRSGNENLVVLSGIGRRTAVARLNGIIQRFGAVAPRAAIAEFPYDGRDFDSLVDAVDDALDRSEGIEADPVIGVDWTPYSRRAEQDVLLVQPDSNLAAVLEAALRRVGVSAQTAQTGDRALSTLLDPSTPKPRLVVLEFDLPGLDGLSILRQLERVGVLSRLNIVMLGARTREADLAAAFDLGVIDVIQKPISPRMAVRRFQRAIDR